MSKNIQYKQTGDVTKYGVTHGEFSLWFENVKAQLAILSVEDKLIQQWRHFEDIAPYLASYKNVEYHEIDPYILRIKKAIDFLIQIQTNKKPEVIEKIESVEEKTSFDTNNQKESFIRKIWKDSVGSKLIAAALIGLMTFFIAKVASTFSNSNKQFQPKEAQISIAENTKSLEPVINKIEKVKSDSSELAKLRNGNINNLNIKEENISSSKQNSNKIKLHKLYDYQKVGTMEGASFVDPLTKATIGISKIEMYSKIDGTISLPNKESQSFEDIQPGHTWKFKYKSKNYNLIYVAGDYLKDVFTIRVYEIE